MNETLFEKILPYLGLDFYYESLLVITLKIVSGLLKCYNASLTFPVVRYGTECHAYINALIRKKITAFETKRYRRMLKIRCIEMQSSNKVLQRGDLDEPQLLKTNLKQKAEFVGHVAK